MLRVCLLLVVWLRVAYCVLLLCCCSRGVVCVVCWLCLPVVSVRWLRVGCLLFACCLFIVLLLLLCVCVCWLFVGRLLFVRCLCVACFSFFVCFLFVP